MRSALATFEKASALTHIKFPVSTEFETAAVLWILGEGKTAVFDSVIGHEGSVVGNVLNNRAKLALACGIPVEELQQYALNAYHAPHSPVQVQDAPCQEIVATADFDLGEMFPIPRISEFDDGRYITAGLILTKDPERGRTNVAIARMQLKGPNRLGCFLAPTDTYRYLAMHRERGTKAEVAVAIGNHPVLLAASQMPPPDDELEFAGGLFGSGVEMASCVSVDLQVPAHAEIVLEGVIDPQVGEPEGPFGEFGGHYNASESSPVIEVEAVTTRRDPIFQMIVGGTHPEHSVTGVVAREIRLLEALRQTGLNPAAVTFPVGGTGRFQAIVALRNAGPGDGVAAILTAFNFSIMLRQVIVVDDDVDVFQRDQVDWAFASRMDPSRDLLVVEGSKAHPRDPAVLHGTVSMVGFDATRGQGSDTAAERRIPDVPESVRNRVLRRLSPDAIPKRSHIQELTKLSET